MLIKPRAELIRPIQYLRAIAALMVVWHHELTQLNGLEAFIGLREFGTSGVDLFFVISGFVMQVTTTRKPLSASEFFRLRVIRVVPLYWLVTLAMVGAALAAPQLFRTLEFTPAAVAKSLLFVPYYSLSFPNFVWPVLVPGWTLNYEMFFYALFAFSLLLPLRLRIGALISVLLGLVLAGSIAGRVSALAVVYTNPLLLEFGAGVVIGALWTRNSLRVGLAVSIAAILVGALLLYRRDEFMNTSQMIGAALMVTGCLNERILAIQSRLWLALGNASYSIYLLHIFVLGVLRSVWVHVSPELSFASAFAFMATGMFASAVVGWLCYRFIERPLTRQLHARSAPKLPQWAHDLARKVQADLRGRLLGH